MSMSNDEFNQRRERALLKLETAANIWHAFTTGPVGATIPTSSGTIPTLAGIIADLRDEHQEEIEPIIATVTDIINNLDIDDTPITTPNP